ncbi:hypothetical protein HPB47_008219 [Ixodes persulcatus]|uniref:Uncharacterized protein n=1 Tax=Ixodes persulcatus TaxID=34615 RepID=A0AC60P5M2_IXOPE|nr:hypothetical protein HPB47_008219 [Ixodes persulcatus]
MGGSYRPGNLGARVQEAIIRKVPVRGEEVCGRPNLSWRDVRRSVKLWVQDRVGVDSVERAAELAEEYATRRKLSGEESESGRSDQRKTFRQDDFPKGLPRARRAPPGRPARASATGQARARAITRASPVHAGASRAPPPAATSTAEIGAQTSRRSEVARGAKRASANGAVSAPAAAALLCPFAPAQ